jgi:hypothetical protein
VATAIALIYLLWVALSVRAVTGAYAGMFNSMNLHVGGLIGFVLRNQRWLYPCFFGSTGTLLITKQFFVRNLWASLGANLVAIVALESVRFWIDSSVQAALKVFVEGLGR